MTIELLLLLLVIKYRHEAMGLFKQEEYDINDYSGLICDAPKPRRHLRIVK